MQLRHEIGLRLDLNAAKVQRQMENFSMSRTVSSSDPDTTRLPSGEKATEFLLAGTCTLQPPNDLAVPSFRRQNALFCGQVGESATRFDCSGMMWNL
jgi:hypothetical protein